ncbi:Uncharacterised protein [Klebsiella pneumoniae]|nr:hypothetical protein AI2919V1_5107 [Klebsiella pneumoniae]SVM06759.1 Uncharacterised protein [Klebsiella pneumoniae]SYN82887.1 Uncharacterised protein [Klebsiella pneumoniae]VAT80309.1 Uncharacterised protein [Klebsiella variicola]
MKASLSLVGKLNIVVRKLLLDGMDQFNLLLTS